MKRFCYIFAVMIMSVLTGCDDLLDKQPLTAISPNNFWKSEEDLQLAANYFYASMYTKHYTLDNQSVDAFGSAPNPVSSGTYAIPNTDDVYSDNYKLIRAANSFLENYQSATELSEAIRERYASEVRFFRAYYYFELLTRFGDVIYVDRTLGMEDELLQSARTDKSEIIDKLIADLQKAVTCLPAKSKINDQARITSGVANGLLARIGLYFGTWYRYHGSDEAKAKKYLAVARNACDAVISSNEYSLDPDYYGMFLLDNAYKSPEVMLAYRYSTATGFNIRIRGTIIDFSTRPTKYLADAFLCKDGLPIGKSSYKVEYLPVAEGAEFNNRDPRMPATIWRPGDGKDWMGKPVLPDYAVNTKTGYLYRKYGNMSAYSSMAQYIDHILMRYAEILVMYAEATFELNGEITDEELNKSINTLRRRFANNPDCLPDLTNAFVKGNGLNMREEIRRERRVELAGESFRYDDIIRWGIADTELVKPILGAKFDAQAYPNINISAGDLHVNEDGFVVVQDALTRFFTDKNWLFPLPLRETSLNSKLTQNPNWN